MTFILVFASMITMKKTDRLHSVLTICIYYGENPWDGPHSLIDMLEIPDAFKPLISDYKFNLIELRKSEYLKFYNDDVNTIFNISRFIFDEKYDKITDIFKDENISIGDLDDNNTKEKYRTYLQQIGTECCRNVFGDNFWCEMLDKEIKCLEAIEE